jgi:hypothetical protein
MAFVGDCMNTFEIWTSVTPDGVDVFRLGKIVRLDQGSTE